jgi:hypothetical protein
MARAIRSAAVACSLCAVALAAGCGGGGSAGPGAVHPLAKLSSALAAAKSDAPKAGASAPGEGSQPKQVPSDVRIRVANFYDQQGQPGPALDIYDVQLNALNGAPATPIITDLAYGAVSSYVQPKEDATTIGVKSVELEALPTGEDPDTSSADAASIGGVIDNGSGVQLTVMLSTDQSDAGILPGALAGMSFSTRLEAGNDGQGSSGPAAPPAPAGKAELLVDATNVPQSGDDSEFLSVDGSCAPPINGDPAFYGKLPEIVTSASSPIKSQFAIFATTPGVHQVSVIAWAKSVAPTCAQLTAKQGTSSVTLTSGEQAMVFVYGNTVKTLHLTIAPISTR